MAVSYGNKCFDSHPLLQANVVLLPGCSAIGKETVRCLAHGAGIITPTRVMEHAQHSSGAAKVALGKQRVYKGPKIDHQRTMMSMRCDGVRPDFSRKGRVVHPTRAGKAAEHGGRHAPTKAAL